MAKKTKVKTVRLNETQKKVLSVYGQIGQQAAREYQMTPRWRFRRRKELVDVATRCNGFLNDLLLMVGGEGAKLSFKNDGTPTVTRA